MVKISIPSCCPWTVVCCPFHGRSWWSKFDICTSVQAEKNYADEMDSVDAGSQTQGLPMSGKGQNLWHYCSTGYCYHVNVTNSWCQPIVGRCLVSLLALIAMSAHVYRPLHTQATKRIQKHPIHFSIPLVIHQAPQWIQGSPESNLQMICILKPKPQNIWSFAGKFVKHSWLSTWWLREKYSYWVKAFVDTNFELGMLRACHDITSQKVHQSP